MIIIWCLTSVIVSHDPIGLIGFQMDWFAMMVAWFAMMVAERGTETSMHKEH